MDFIKKSIAAKMFLLLLTSFTIFAGVDYFAGQYLQNYFGDYYRAIVFFGLFLVTFVVFVVCVSHPFSKIFNEMKALLTGRPYKKIFTGRIDEVGVLAHFFNDITKNIERISVDIAEGKRMSSELSIGSDIQRKILPKEMPQIPGISIYGSTRPASEVSGDTFDIIQAPGGNTYVYVGDVTGHGVPAALIMIMVNTLIRTFSEIYGSGYDVMVHTNRILKQRIEPRRFMTCVLLRWDSQGKKMFFTGVGHEHILVFRKRDSKCEVKQTGGIALGMVPNISKIIKEEQIPLDTGDFIVLYSDGIIEAKNMSGEMYGLNRLKTTIEQYALTSTPEDLFVNISREFAGFTGEQIQTDDITLIALQRNAT